jgi:hypothetical protein
MLRRPSMTVEARFLSFVETAGLDDCWPWRGSTNKGYGQFSFNGKPVGSHIMSYNLFRGTLKSGEVVRHSCDNPICVNPRHLDSGTHADNVADKVSRGRQAFNKGEKNGKARLKEGDVKAIRASEMRVTDLARHYDVPKSLISNIRLNKLWRSVA